MHQLTKYYVLNWPDRVFNYKGRISSSKEHTPCFPITWQLYKQWMAKYALNTQNNLIKGHNFKKIIRSKLQVSANIHIYTTTKL